LPEVAAELQGVEIKGECALVLSCPAAEAAPEADLETSLLEAAREQGLSGRRLALAVAAALKVPRRRVYQVYLALKEQGRLE
jgi:16S rRNA C1402 (ribose-2'-O) methylase RsmI